mmetsp:Transcript_16897/g.43965  ORF Transcript_16897/g.43965 Transcript_16897/m.43965 type:complete len:206 (-) Transcript_16897:17-634(-)
MSLRTNVRQLGEVVVVYMGKDPEHSPEDLLDNRGKVLWEGCVDRWREDRLVVDRHFDPVHQQFDVLGSREPRRFLVLAVVLPIVLVLDPRRHCRAALLGAEVRHRAVDQVDPVEKIHHVHRVPLVGVLIRRENDSFVKVHIEVQRRRGLLVEIITQSPFFKFLLRSEGLCSLEHGYSAPPPPVHLPSQDSPLSLSLLLSLNRRLA